MTGSVFFVDDERSIRLSLQQALELEDMPVTCFEKPHDLLKQINDQFEGVIVSDINMPGLNGLELMERVHQIDKELPVILLTGHGDISTAVDAMRKGAYDFIEKPFDTDLMIDVVNRALDKRQLTLENRQLKNQLSFSTNPGPRILGNTPAMVQMKAILQQIVNAPTDVLLHGETGTGKDLIARWLHEASDRQDNNFVAINCGAIPEHLIESELFGHEPGAFTGADKARVGKFEHANGGTVFLDEIESMPLNLQVKLLRILEDRKVERLGSNQPIDLNVRVIAATKTDLKELSQEGKFRSDLYYRLAIVKVDIPALRDRLQDIPLLFHNFALVAADRFQREWEPPSSERMARLLQHNWPGNVRELRNLAERYLLMGDLAFDLLGQSPSDQSDQPQSLQALVEQYEASLIATALQKSGGSIKGTMELLNLARKTLYDKMKKYGLDKTDFKD